MPDPVASSSDAELRAHVERALSPHYELDREIGRGGMGIVYCARDRRLKRNVAIKILPPELAFRHEIRSRFLREAETAAQLSHPDIVPIYSVDEIDNLVFFVMAYVRGVNLARRIHDMGRLGGEEARRILREVADALAYAHARGVIHRDIKPDNILLDEETGRAMVTDFGIARAVTEGQDSRLTATGMALGTPTYMSPEQAAGEREIDGRSDLYSLGVVGYQMLTGEPPFTAASTPALLVKHITERPRPIEAMRPDVSPELARAVMLCLEKEPASRFPDAGALVAALQGGPLPLSTAAPAAASGNGAARPLTTGYAGAGAGVAAPAWSPVPAPAGAAAGAATAGAGLYVPSEEERRRWDAAIVHQFRRKLKLWGIMAPVLFVIGLFNNGPFMFIALAWTVYITYRYARLWSDGYDWRDVFRQPRERILLDVATEAIETAQDLLDADRRRELRARARERARLARPSEPLVTGATTPATLLEGPYASTLRQAASDRDEIIRLVDTLPPTQRGQLEQVVPSARALHDRVVGLATSLAELERSNVPGASDALEREIAQLEAQANPLDRAASEERVRRLAYLKRQRRAVADVSQRRAKVAAKLESCALALQNMRFDVLRLRAGTQSHEHVTSLALEAMSLARDVDTALYVADEMGKIGGGREAGSGRR